MAPTSDPGGRGAAREERLDEDEATPTHPRPELRWVQIREPRQAVELGANGRVLASRYHDGYDAWEVLLETYEGELSGRAGRRGRGSE